MQIVIDIDVRAYNKCLKLVDDNDGGILGMHLINAVANGAPLPKGHGDCISRTDVLKLMCEKCPVYNCITGCQSYKSIEKMSYTTLKSESEE